MNLPYNIERGGVFHCPIVCHYAATTFNETLEGFRNRCNRAPCVICIYELAD